MQANRDFPRPPRWLQLFCAWLLRVLGWRAEGRRPEYKKLVMIGYPHTSNWDAVFGLLVFTALGVRLNWLGKHTLFRGPLGWLLRKTGGMPIHREKSQNFTRNVRTIFDQSDYLLLALSPEGTRKKTPYWRTGFYFIARTARVPIVLGYLDYSRKRGGFGPVLQPSGNLQQDLLQIKAFYRNIQGKFPEKMGPIRIRERKRHE